MRLTSCIALVAGCGTTAAPEPWIPGVTGFATSSTSRATSRGADRLAEVTGDPVEPYGAVELVADVGPTDGTETVLAGYSRIVVLDATGKPIADAAGLEPAGSRDEVRLAAVGDTHVGTPIIAVITSTGGRREEETWLVLYALDGQRLVRAFAGVLETRSDDDVVTGQVSFDRSGLDYRRPGDGLASRWTFDMTATRYRRPGDPLRKESVP